MGLKKERDSDMTSSRSHKTCQFRLKLLLILHLKNRVSNVISSPRFPLMQIYKARSFYACIINLSRTRQDISLPLMIEGPLGCVPIHNSANGSSSETSRSGETALASWATLLFRPCTPQAYFWTAHSSSILEK